MDCLMQLTATWPNMSGGTGFVAMDVMITESVDACRQ